MCLYVIEVVFGVPGMCIKSYHNVYETLKSTMKEKLYLTKFSQLSH